MTIHSDASGQLPASGETMAPIVYHVDRCDQVVWIGPGWTPFAEANDATSLVPEGVLRQPLRAWVTGSGAWNLYALLMHRVRRTREPIAFPFRCDAPAVRRFLTMTVAPLEAGGLSFESHLVRAEPREPVALLDRNHPRSERFVSVCSWCKRVRVGERLWLEAEAAVAELDLFGADSLPELTHGICPVCAGQLMNFGES